MLNKDCQPALEEDLEYERDSNCSSTSPSSPASSIESSPQSSKKHASLSRRQRKNRMKRETTAIPSSQQIKQTNKHSEKINAIQISNDKKLENKRKRKNQAKTMECLNNFYNSLLEIEQINVIGMLQEDRNLLYTLLTAYLATDEEKIAHGYPVDDIVRGQVVIFRNTQYLSKKSKRKRLNIHATGYP